jgi:MFS family permease
MRDGPTPPATPRSWSALGAGFTVLFVATGVHFSFGILFKSILLELGSDRSTLALAVTASLLANALGQPAFGALVDRFGPRRVILASMALLAAGTGLVAAADRPWHVILLYGVVAAVGYTGSGILPISVHIARWFPGERGFVTAVAACGFSLGQLVFAQVAAGLVAAVGWRATYVALAGILVTFLAGIAVWLRDAPPAAAGQPLGASPATAAGPSLSRRDALATVGFWGLTLGLVGCGFTDFLLTTHLAPFATDLGLSTGVAANALSLWAAANVVGILLAGGIATRLGTRTALVLTYLVRASALFWLPRVREEWQLYVFAVLFGATFFTTAPLSSTMVGQLFGPAHHGAIFGAANFFHHTAGALGSWAGGLAFDLTRSYTGIFLASGVVVLGSATASALARPPRRGNRA